MKFVIAGMMLLGMAGLAWAADPPSSNPAPMPAPVSDKAIAQIDSMIAKAGIDKTKSDWKTHVPQWQPVTYDPAHAYFVSMVTNKGTIVIKMHPDWAPNHVTNFLYLTKLGFYDGIPFHRVIPGFMAQGGDPLGSGRGGPGYMFDGEFKPTVTFTKAGLLAMANSGPGTDGSQFFITFKDTSWLNGKHTIFGEVVEGMDTLKKFEAAGTPQSGATTEPLKMETVTVAVKNVAK